MRLCVPQEPIVVFRTDFRAADEPGKAPFNLMLSKSAARCLDVAFKDAERSVPADVEFVAPMVIGAVAEIALEAKRAR